MLQKQIEMLPKKITDGTIHEKIFPSARLNAKKDIDKNDLKIFLLVFFLWMGLD